ncbi:MAG: TrmH family RNA methyltransferase [Bacteroidales bacterium]
MNEQPITSLQNQRIKEFVSLGTKSSERRKSGLFVVEGTRECLAAGKAGYQIDTLLWVRDMVSEEFIKSLRAVRAIEITSQVYEKVAYRGGTEGVIATVKHKNLKLDHIKLSDNPLIIVLESVEKPGNLGAVLRTADAVKADAVIVTCTSKEAYEWLIMNKIRIFTAELQASEWYHLTDMTTPMAIVMGTEAEGLKEFWRERADQRIKIPMRGELDSLNVSVSTAILCYEALRQRDFK